jgi:hypothetical protein
MDDLRRWSKPATDSRRIANRQWRMGERRFSGGYCRGSNRLERARLVELGPPRADAPEQLGGLGGTTEMVTVESYLRLTK